MYQILPMFSSSFVDVLEFRSSPAGIVAIVNLFLTCQLPMFDFYLDLPNVPQQVKDIMNEQVYYYFVQPIGVRQEMPFEKLIHPCVIFENIFLSTNVSIMLSVPCSAIHENN